MMRQKHKADFQARYGISWGAIGAAIACYECALDYARSLRAPFDDARTTRAVIETFSSAH